MRAVPLLLLVALASPAAAAPAPAPSERAPIGVFWLGAPGQEGIDTVRAIYGALDRTTRARALPEGEARVALTIGGPVARLDLELALADQAFVDLKVDEALRHYQAAESMLLGDVPLADALQRIGVVERKLLVCDDQRGRSEDAARAAERVTWAPGSTEDVASLLDKHLRSRRWDVPLPPTHVESDPPGAEVYRDLTLVGHTPLDVDGGDPRVDVVDVIAPGRVRAHAALGTGQQLVLSLAPETRYAVLVDEARRQAPAVAPAAVADLGRRAGATRLLAVMPDGQRVLVRWFDVAAGNWGGEVLRVDRKDVDRIAAYATAGLGPQPAAAAAAVATAHPAAAKTKWGAWGKWYTWAAAAGVVAVVVTLLVVQNVGESTLTVTASH